MNRRILASFLCALLALAMTSRTVHAQRGGGGWDWLDKLSGPGPFNGPYVFTSFCIGGEKPVQYTKCDLQKDGIWLNLGVSYVWTGRDSARGFPRVAIFAFEQSVDLRVKQFKRVYFEWGFGYGIHHFGGEDFEDFWRMSFEPVRLGAVFPWGEGETLLFQLRFTTTYFVDGFTAADFGSAGDFEARGEFVPAILGSVVFNVPSLFR